MHVLLMWTICVSNFLSPPPPQAQRGWAKAKAVVQLRSGTRDRSVMYTMCVFNVLSPLPGPPTRPDLMHMFC